MIVSPRQRSTRVVQYSVLGLYMLFLAFPLLWMLSISLKGPQELVQLHPHVIPSQPTYGNYTDAIQHNGLLHAAWNSFKVSSITAILAVFVAVPAAYVLARQKGLISKVGMGWILLSQMFPLILIIIPLFLVLKDLHLINTHFGLIATYLVWTLPFSLWMLQSYVRGIPPQLEEAAMVDGAGRLTILRTIIAPLLGPGIVVVGLFVFVQCWNEFFFALVLLDSPNLSTLSLLLARFVGIEGIVRLGPLAASALLATIPSLLIFAFIQRFLTRGLLAGAVKG